MPDPAWIDQIATIMDAAKAAGCTEWERQHALDLLATWHSVDKALGWVAACVYQRKHAEAAGAQARCPYVGEF
jgi:hypothetical protein